MRLKTFARPNHRANTPAKQDDIVNLLPEYLISPENLSLDKSKETWMEIGFGYGEHLLHKAKLYPNINFIGCEVYVSGCINLARNLKEGKIENVGLFNEDARDLLDAMKDDSLDRLFVLFPDPWTKVRHHKRRIINEEFLSLIIKKMKNNGKFLFASDIINYVEWTSDFCNKFKELSACFNSIEECKEEPSDWIKTRFQLRAIDEGRNSYFLEYEVRK